MLILVSQTEYSVLVIIQISAVGAGSGNAVAFPSKNFEEKFGQIWLD